METTTNNETRTDLRTRIAAAGAELARAAGAGEDVAAANAAYEALIARFERLHGRYVWLRPGQAEAPRYSPWAV